MTAAPPAPADYDPRWRCFAGGTGFAPHPSALLAHGVRAPAYARVAVAGPPRRTMFSGSATRGAVPNPRPAFINPGMRQPAASLPAPERTPERKPEPTYAATPSPAPQIAVSPGAARPQAPAARMPQPGVIPDPAQTAPPPQQAQPALPAEAAAPRPAPHPLFSPAAAPIPGAVLDDLRFRAPAARSPRPKLATLYRGATASGPSGRAIPKRHWRFPASRIAALAAFAAALGIGGLSAAVLPGILAAPATLASVLTVPMLLLRAVGPGQIATLPVAVGQAIEPATVLLTIRTNHISDAALGDLHMRLAQARLRQNAPAAATLTHSQIAAAALEIEQLERAAASARAGEPVDQPVRAGVHGMVWALNTHSGAPLLAGDPLAQLADCGRAFLPVRDSSPALTPGQAVLIHMPGLPPFHGTVRLATGVAEPAGGLVIDPTDLAAVAPNGCPVGGKAEIRMGG